MMRPATKTSPQLTPSLIADIGATNARFGLTNPGGEPTHTKVLVSAHYPSLEDAIRAYFKDIGLQDPIRSAAIAVAAPITSDQITLPNNPWSFSIEQTRLNLKLDTLRIINDFTALALSIPLLEDQDRHQVGSGTAIKSAPIAVIGPGTGLGVSGLIYAGDQWTALATEGGHVTMAGFNDRETDILRVLRGRFEHVSAERVISGMGLQNLYKALCVLNKQPEIPMDPSDIVARGISNECTMCREAVDTFCAMLGTIAGNLALSLGSRGGLYIAGGIVPKMGAYFDSTAFRERFEAKGRMRIFLTPIPTYVITHKLPAFLGLQAAVSP